MCRKSKAQPSASPVSARTIGLTGSIGAGKSLVARVCALRGIPVYDCDSRAKRLMDSDARLLESICVAAACDVRADGGVLDRTKLAGVIFTDVLAKAKVERLVHAAVRENLEQWLGENPAPVRIVESAILHTSGLDERVDEIWLVQAPASVRLHRALRRGRIDRVSLLRRMEAQTGESDSLPSHKVKTIDNSGGEPLLPKINQLLNDILCLGK